MHGQHLALTNVSPPTAPEADTSLTPIMQRRQLRHTENHTANLGHSLDLETPPFLATHTARGALKEEHCGRARCPHSDAQNTRPCLLTWQNGICKCDDMKDLEKGRISWGLQVDPMSPQGKAGGSESERKIGRGHAAGFRDRTGRHRATDEEESGNQDT